ncbi:R3H and coiled-coil domain-containing protein 1-like [Chiloscyllium punctatum]|uniref:R3H and coiled-coil domain-containing protein 1-like n=1 Tax=Chiloscyllium punctatum TaxID=137246 RepID=UPI003B632398
MFHRSLIDKEETESLKEIVCLILALLHLDGVYLSKEEDEFVEKITQELESFLRKTSDDANKVLLLPPLPSRLRYLTHRTVETFPHLDSFSVGEGAARRTAVCLAGKRSHPTPDERQACTEVLSHWAERNGRERQTEGSAALRDRPLRSQRLPPGNSKTRKRPERTLYTPRPYHQYHGDQNREVRSHSEREVTVTEGKGAAREDMIGCSTVTIAAAEEVGDGPSGQAVQDVIPQCATSSGNVAVKEGGGSPIQPLESPSPFQKGRLGEASAAEEPMAQQDPRLAEERERWAAGPGAGISCPASGCALEDVMPLSEPVVPEPGVQSLAQSPGSEAPQQPSSANTVAGLQHCQLPQGMEDPVLAEQDASGSCTDLLHVGELTVREQGAAEVAAEGDETACGSSACPPDDTAELLRELSACMGEISITIEQPNCDYSTCLPQKDHTACLELRHIIEIYDFSPQLTTEDLQQAFATFHDKGFRIKWVDSTHALGIFSCPGSASEALSLSHSELKTCPLAQATKQSKLKVARSSEFLQPVKERAQTSTVIAKRLVFRALGLRLSDCKEQREPRFKNRGHRKVEPDKEPEDGTVDTVDSAVRE